MDVSEIQSAIEEHHFDDESDGFGFRMLVSSIGELAQMLAGLESGSNMFSDEERKKVLEQELASIIFTLCHLAIEEGIDLDVVMESFTEVMIEEAESKERWDTALDEGDFETLKEMMKE